ncbi:hypothetical protein TNIN_113461 [Trichonephila inaurata madagascariensis]|uniref:Uncharacterized protein n=1 Tax=Trichonephila inaurata madagascariensis TaxID=2747483 RepID=A0A8X7CR06_9ARAC|nr:hypothetical protein TNIN_113461 [Trichonephila inaurata madagascariensis]
MIWLKRKLQLDKSKIRHGFLRVMRQLFELRGCSCFEGKPERHARVFKKTVTSNRGLDSENQSCSLHQLPAEARIERLLSRREEAGVMEACYSMSKLNIPED